MYTYRNYVIFNRYNIYNIIKGENKEMKFIKTVIDFKIYAERNGSTVLIEVRKKNKKCCLTAYSRAKFEITKSEFSANKNAQVLSDIKNNIDLIYDTLNK